VSAVANGEGGHFRAAAACRSNRAAQAQKVEYVSVGKPP
jgi:hypothetical protein